MQCSTLCLMLLLLVSFEVGWSKLLKHKQNTSSAMKLHAPEKQPMKTYYLKLKVFYDKKLRELIIKNKRGLQRLTKNDYHKYTKHLIIKLNEYFKDINLKIKLRFKPIGTISEYENSKVNSSMDYLREFCNQEKNFKEENTYFSLLLTGTKIGAENYEEIPSKLGRSFVKAFCSKQRSCAIVRWGYSVPVEVAHEIAHALGIKHNSYHKSNCTKNYATIMDGKTSYKKLTFITKGKRPRWTSCNSDDLLKFIRSPYFDGCRKDIHLRH